VKPTPDDLRALAVPLIAVSAGLQRTLRGSADSSALAILASAAQRDNVRPSEVANALGVHQSSITRQVRTLETAGHVTLVEDPADRRSCFIRITDSGRKEVERLNQIGLERFAAFVEGWDAEEVRELGRLLSQLEASIVRVKLRERAPVGRRWQGRDRS
jgi:DNA-binding MarR family transcriptional regulator